MSVPLSVCVVLVVGTLLLAKVKIFTSNLAEALQVFERKLILKMD